MSNFSDLHKSLKAGKLLIAEPFLTDAYFKRAVVLLTHHSSHAGSFGFILNHPLPEMRVASYLPISEDFDAPIFYGGPIYTDRLYFVHTFGDLLDGSFEISRGVYWGGEFEQLKVLINEGLIENKDIRFFIGCSSWDINQLAGEMLTNSWILTDCDPNYVFSKKPEQLWKQTLHHKGNGYIVIGDMDDEDRLN